ncbi:RING-like domain-containing protein [Rutstroemia sp. NJR-2017a BBW]|nr:RING-like domain-containing protein [Rutstroemia sp. NJR-2017a BBW]
MQIKKLNLKARKARYANENTDMPAIKGKATATVSGRTIAETDSWEVVEGNVYVCFSYIIESMKGDADICVVVSTIVSFLWYWMLWIEILIWGDRSVNQSMLAKTDHSTHCPWKGDASYYTINLDKTELKNAAWFYPDPKEKAMNIKDYVAFYGRVTSAEEVSHEDIMSYISAAADALSPFDYEIRSTKHQLSNEQIWALVNSTSDPLTQLATAFSTEEMFYIKRILDAMFETFNTKGREVMAITSQQAIHSSLIKGAGRQSMGGDDLQTVDNGVTREAAERVLANLVAQGWFERSRKGYYSLTPRALLELRGWLLEMYNDPDEPEEWQPIKNCEACKGIITVGERCPRRDCSVRLHGTCQTAYWNSRRNKKCPKCETEWDGRHFVGERVITQTEDNLREKRKSGGAVGVGVGVGVGSSRKRRAEPEPEPEEDEAAVNENDDPE